MEAAGVLASGKVLHLTFSDEAPSRANAHNTVLQLTQQLREAHERLAVEQKRRCSATASGEKGGNTGCKPNGSHQAEEGTREEQARPTKERGACSHTMQNDSQIMEQLQHDQHSKKGLVGLMEQPVDRSREQRLLHHASDSAPECRLQCSSNARCLRQKAPMENACLCAAERSATKARQRQEDSADTNICRYPDYFPGLGSPPGQGNKIADAMRHLPEAATTNACSPLLSLVKCSAPSKACTARTGSNMGKVPIALLCGAHTDAGYGGESLEDTGSPPCALRQSTILEVNPGQEPLEPVDAFVRPYTAAWQEYRAHFSGTEHEQAVAEWSELAVPSSPVHVKRTKGAVPRPLQLVVPHDLGSLSQQASRNSARRSPSYCAICPGERLPLGLRRTHKCSESAKAEHCKPLHGVVLSSGQRPHSAKEVHSNNKMRETSCRTAGHLQGGLCSSPNASRRWESVASHSSSKLWATQSAKVVASGNKASSLDVHAAIPHRLGSASPTARLSERRQWAQSAKGSVTSAWG
jgi:hypothetical protein